MFEFVDLPGGLLVLTGKFFVARLYARRQAELDCRFCLYYPISVFRYEAHRNRHHRRFTCFRRIR